jgi:hypothetical protein
MSNRYFLLLRKYLFAIITVLLSAAALLAQQGEGTLDPSSPKGIGPEEIIQKFAAREAEFKKARDEYTYRQSVKVQEMDGDTPDGEYSYVVDILFDDKGKRIENVVNAPQPTLKRISMSREDFDDIEKRLPFVLTTVEIPDYNIKYVGQQTEDELQTYVFDVAPKKIEKNRRYFDGRIWVDNHDFQIVKSYGRNIPDYHSGTENLFPSFTTYREQIDGQYWFPTYTKVDDTLHFKTGDVHIRQIVKYFNYKRFGSKSKIIYQGQELPENQKPQSQPQPPPK